MLSTGCFDLFFSFSNHAYSQLAEHYGLDTASAILDRNHSKSLTRTTPTTPALSTRAASHSSSREDIPLHPLKSKYARQRPQPF